MATDKELEQSRRDTNIHIMAVNYVVSSICARLMGRAANHDASKLEGPELETFATYGPKLKEMAYGSEEYKAALEGMGPALQHHYENNSHHPEFFENGVDGMNLLDLIEMVCDWKAATLRMKDRDFKKSLEYNKERFGLSDQLYSIISNSADILEEAVHGRDEH